MSYLLVGAFIALIVSIPVHFEMNWWQRSLKLFGTFTALFTVITSLLTTSIVGPFGGSTIIFPVIIGLGIRTIVTVILRENTSRGDHKSYYPGRVLGLCGVAFLIMVIIPLLIGSAYFRSDEYRDMAGKHVVKSDWKSDIAPIDDAHIRLVSLEQAEWKTSQQMGQDGTSLGSKYQLGELSIQKVGNELVWVGPLEFQGLGAWSNFDTTPGFVMVSAEDPNAVPKLVTGHKFRYMLSAYFGDDLRRYLYTHGYQFKNTTDFTFEVDDQLNPFWVVTVYEPTIGFYGEAVTEVLLVNPTTGNIQSFAPDKVPEWVDRIVPESFAHERLVNHGQYIHGWKNGWWGQGDVTVPTLKDLKLVWTDDGHAQWFTGLTSPSNKDEALVGFALTDSRTGVVREYVLSGSNESSVDSIVNKAVANYPGYGATQPILYNIYGELSWVVPVVSGGIFQRVALVRAKDGTVALGKNKHEALAEYRKLLTTSGNKDVPTTQMNLQMISGEINRYASAVTGGDTTFYLTIGDSPHIFTGSVATSNLLPIAHVGDHAVIKYGETKERVVPMTSFEMVSWGFPSDATSTTK